MIGTLILILVVLWIVGSLPHWGYMQGRQWGYGPSIGGIVVLLLILWLLFGGGGLHLGRY